jgi:hypothetical protein
MRHLLMLGALLATTAVPGTPAAAQSDAGVAAAVDVIPSEATSVAFSTANGAAMARLAPDHASRPGNAIEWMAASDHSTRSEGTALMIVGAAGIIVGLIVDEPIITVAGAVTGGIGLYLFLRHGGEIKVDSRHTPATTADWVTAPASAR